jgi:hypothetical protein
MSLRAGVVIAVVDASCSFSADDFDFDIIIISPFRMAIRRLLQERRG